MKIHICKHCGKTFEYCRGCLLSPIIYKGAGYCSQVCYDASKNKEKEVIPTEDVEVVITDRDISTSE